MLGRPCSFAPALPAGRLCRGRSYAAPRRIRQPFQTHAAVGSEKEQALKYRRVQYDDAQWKDHRSTNRYTRHYISMFSSRIVRGLAYPILAEGMLCALICFYDEAHQSGVMPWWLPGLPRGIPVPLTLSSFALSLLLAYRTGASYNRWREARAFWATVVLTCRDLMRQSVLWMDPQEERGKVEVMARWLAVFPWAMMCHLRVDDDLRTKLQGRMPTADLDYLAATGHAPNTALQILASTMWSSSVPVEKKVRMDRNLTVFADMLGASERILRTPIPLAYTRHTSRFLMVFLFGTPFALYGAIGNLGAIPASMFIAFVLLGIEEIAVQIEEPFSVLPLEAYCLEVSAEMQQYLAHKPLYDEFMQVRGQLPPCSPEAAA